MISIPIPFTTQYPHYLDIPYNHVCSWRWYLSIGWTHVQMENRAQFLTDTLQNKWAYDKGIAWHVLSFGYQEGGRWTIGDWKVKIDSFWHDGPHTSIQVGWFHCWTTNYELYCFLQKLYGGEP